MAQMTIEQFATELKMPAPALIEQLAAAGVDAKKTGDELTEQDKTRLLDYLRKQHGAASEPKKRITLTRRQTTEIKAPDAANNMKISAQDLLGFGIIDGIIPEPPGGAHRHPEAVLGETRNAIEAFLAAFGDSRGRLEIREQRREKFLAIGSTLG